MHTNNHSLAKQESTNKPQVKRIAVFFYGSFMRHEVMKLAGFAPKTIEVAKLSGYDIEFDPHANVFRSDQHSICGIVVYPSHDELNKMYARDGVGVFLPEAVIVETKDNRHLPVMCYMPPSRGTEPADIAYIDKLIESAKENGLPSWYINRLTNKRN